MITLVWETILVTADNTHPVTWDGSKPQECLSAPGKPPRPWEQLPSPSTLPCPFSIPPGGNLQAHGCGTSLVPAALSTLQDIQLCLNIISEFLVCPGFC